MMRFWRLLVLGILLAGAIPPAVSAAAERGARTNTLWVAVTDSAGGPLEGAAVTVEDLSRTRVTGPDGNAVFPDIPAGRYAIVVRRVGYRPVLRRAELPGPGRIRLALASAAVVVEPITVTATRAPLDPNASPLPTETIGGERLRRHEEVSLAHTLDGVAGMRVSSTGLQVGKPIMRGLSGPRVLVLDNGLRLEDYSWSDEDGPSVDPRLADRVEVVRGPASVMYGSDAVGGVINVIPRDLPDASGGSGFIRGETGFSAGTNNAAIGVPLELEGASGSIGWRASAIARAADNFHTPTGNDSTPSGELFNTGYHAVNGDIAIGLHGARADGMLRYTRYGGDFDLLDGPPVPADNAAGPLRKLTDDRLQLSANWVFRGTRLETRSQWERHSLKELVDQSRIGDEEPTFELLLNTVTTDLLLHHAERLWLSGVIGFSGLYQNNESEGMFPLVPAAR